MQQNLKRLDLSLLKQEIASLMLCCLLIAFQIYSVSHAHDFELEREFNCGLCHKTNSYADVWVEPGAPSKWRASAVYNF